MRKRDIEVLSLIHRLYKLQILKKVFFVPQSNKDDVGSLCMCKINKDVSEQKTKSEIVGFGYSFSSLMIGLIKGVGEAVERYSSCFDSKEGLKISSWIDLKKSALDVRCYNNNSLVERQSYRWVSGHNITTDDPIFIPAQLVYTNYFNYYQEPRLSPSVVFGSGGAFGYSHEQALLSGIYELVERDAFMTGLINNNSPREIDVLTLTGVLGKIITDLILNRSYSVRVFDISNDLCIPTFLSIITHHDRLYIGLKSGLHPQNTIIGCVEEGMLEMMVDEQGMLKKKVTNKGSYFVSRQKLKKLYLDNKIISPISISTLSKPIQLDSESSFIINILKRKRIDIYYRDITPTKLKHNGFVVNKVIIPKLQPLFLTNRSAEIRKLRIEESAAYFKKIFYSS